MFVKFSVDKKHMVNVSEVGARNEESRHNRSRPYSWNGINAIYNCFSDPSTLWWL